MSDTVQLLVQAVTCPLCHGPFVNPHSFGTCGHTFCRVCVVERLEGPGVTSSMCPTCRQPAWKNDLVYNHRMANVVESVKCLAGVTCGPLKQGHGPASQPGDQSQGAEGGGRPTKRPRRSGRRAGSGKRGAPRLPDRGHPGAQARAGWVHGGSQGAAGVGGLAQPSEDSGVDAGGRGPGIDSSPAPAPAVIAASPAPAAAGPGRPVVAAAIPPAALPRAVCGALACADADPGALPPEPGLEPGCLPDTSPGRSKARVCQACASQLDLDRVVLASQQDRASCAELSSPMPGESSGAAALGKPEAPARDQEAGGVKGLDLDSPSCAGGPGLDATPPGLATPPLRHEMLLLQRAILLCDVLGTLGPTAEALPGTEAERPALEEQADTAGASPADVSPGTGRSTEPGAPATGGDDAARPPCRPPTSQGTVCAPAASTGWPATAVPPRRPPHPGRSGPSRAGRPGGPRSGQARGGSASPRPRSIAELLTQGSQRALAAASLRGDGRRRVVLSSPAHRALLAQLAERLGGAEEGGEVTRDTTHVIVATDARGVVATRVMKLCQALAVGCWILAPAWLEACMEAGAWVPEQAFEVKANGCCLGGPARARKRADRGCPGLFAGRTFRIVGKGPLHAAGLTKAIELAGGSIVTRSLPGACLVSLQNDLEFLSKAWKSWGVQPVTSSWILDHLSRQEELEPVQQDPQENSALSIDPLSV
ncbi:hypothetical protein ACKKBG_A19475 [Auxenochlorella protothecoides x Auxenochlorella symbiontica]